MKQNPTAHEKKIKIKINNNNNNQESEQIAQIWPQLRAAAAELNGRPNDPWT
jgi:hypothetical protein